MWTVGIMRAGTFGRWLGLWLAVAAVAPAVVSLVGLRGVQPFVDDIAEPLRPVVGEHVVLDTVNPHEFEHPFRPREMEGACRGPCLIDTVVKVGFHLRFAGRVIPPRVFARSSEPVMAYASINIVVAVSRNYKTYDRGDIDPSQHQFRIGNRRRP